MVFSSIIFLFLFLPVVLTLYFLLSAPAFLLSRRFGIRLGNLLLLVSSLFFYTWGEKWFVFVMLASTLVDYVCGLVISGGWRFDGKPIETLEKGVKRTTTQRIALVASVCTNLAILGFFKYFNFGMENVNAFADLMGWQWLKWNDVIRVTLPLGISFYTFQSLSYTIDVYRGETRATRDVLDFACFVTLFPQLVAGPIVRYRDIARQLVDRVISREKFASGVNRFILGLSKKVLIANSVAGATDKIFAIPDSELTMSLAWLSIFCYALQIYFDFSGYSDMAIGLGRMFGFTFLENFNYPYISKSIREFWRRWHMSLSRWFRDYLYIPLGGNNAPMLRIYFNLLVVFFLCGLWHGAAWTYVIFGLYHGLLMVIERLGFGRWLERRWFVLQHLYMLLVSMFGWVFFRSESLAQAKAFFLAMVGFGEGTGVVYYPELYLRSNMMLALICGTLLSFPIVPWVVKKYKYLVGLPAVGFLGEARLDAIRVSAAMPDDEPVQEPGLPGGITPLFDVGAQLIRLGVLLALLFACILSLSSGTHNPFIYFRF